MTTEEFWQIIDTVHRDADGEMEKKCDLLRQRLNGLTSDELSDFIKHFDQADAAGYSWELWGAAYVIHGGCSDDSFSDFRATLISHGSEVYRTALADPESLAVLDVEDEEDLFNEGFQYIKHEVAEVTLGQLPQRTESFPSEPKGKEWDEDTVEDLYPTLAAKYCPENRNGDKDRDPRKPWWKFW